jgi:hypothetical protein
MPTSVTGPGGVGGVTNIQGMDLETAMMMVQSQRAELLESNMKDQLTAVSNRNKEIANLNSAMEKLRGLQASVSGLKDTDKINDQLKDHDYQIEREVNQLLMDGQAQVTGSKDNMGRKTDPTTGKTTNAWPGSLNGNYTKAELTALIESIKGAIDTKNSSQQMDMLRLQSLTNKRNEAFDLMTNFIKKMQDGRSSIIGNMR